MEVEMEEVAMVVGEAQEVVVVGRVVVDQEVTGGALMEAQVELEEEIREQQQVLQVVSMFLSGILRLANIKIIIARAN